MISFMLDETKVKNFITVYLPYLNYSNSDYGPTVYSYEYMAGQGMNGIK